MERCLREDPGDRFTDARSLGDALSTVDGDGDMGVVRRIRSQARPTRRLPAAGKATTSWPAPTEVSRRRRSIGARIAAVVAALAIVAAGVVIATDSGGSGSPTKADRRQATRRTGDFRPDLERSRRAGAGARGLLPGPGPLSAQGVVFGTGAVGVGAGLVVVAGVVVVGAAVVGAVVGG